MKILTQFLSENLNKRDRLGKTGVDGKIIFKYRSDRNKLSYNVLGVPVRKSVAGL
jgi:hypothetical protein